MKKIVNFLNLPFVNLVAGLIIFLFGGHCIYVLGDSFSKPSAFVGAIAVIGLSIFDYGLFSFFKKRK